MADTYDGEVKLGVTLTPTDIRKSAKELRQEVENAFNASSGNLDKNLQKTLSQLDKLNTKSKELEKSLQQLEEQKIPTEDYSKIQKELEKAEEALEKLYTKREQYEDLGKSVPKSLEYQITNAEAKTERLQRGLQELLDAGKAFTLGSDSEEFQRKSQQLSQVNNQMGILLKSAEKYNEESEESASVDQSRLSAINSLVPAFKKLGNIVSKTAVTGFNLLTRKVREFGKTAENATKKTSRLASSFVRAMVGVRGIYMLFRKFRSAVTEGIKNLQEFDKENNEFAQSMDSLKANLTFVKNSFGAVFAPLIQLVVPYLNMAAQAVGNLMNKLGALFAMLTGKSTFYAAKTQVDEYGKAINKAAGSQKKLNAELYGFDTLNRQQDNNGSGGSDVSNMFEELSTDSFLGQNVKDFLNVLKELWDNKDYYGIGKIVAEGFNEGVKALNKAIKDATPKLIDGAKNIAQGINGFVDGFNWKDFGTTFSEGLNSIVNTTDTFFKEFKFFNLGKGIGETITSFFQGTEWDSLAGSIALKINALFSFIDGIISNEELLPSMGTAIRNAIYGFFDTLDPELIKNSITNVINSVANLIAETDWGETFDMAFDGLTQIVDWLVELIGNIDWEKVGNALGGMLMSLYLKLFSPQTMIKVLGHVTSWVLQLISSLITFILSAWSGAFSKVIEKSKELGWDTIAGFFQGVKDEFDIWIDAFKNWFKDMIQAVKDIFGIHSPSTVFSDIGGNIIEGLKNGILAMWDKVKQGIYDTFDGFTKKVKGIFGISSPSKVFAEYGKFIDLGFAQGIEGDKAAVEFAMEDVINGITDSASFTPKMNIPSFATMPIPALATGGVVPPGAYGSSPSFDINALFNKIQTLIDIIEADRDRTIEIHNHLELDGDEIYDNVVEHNNQQIQRSGSSRLIV